ncbi:YdeI/OmpD-associated family protein [Microbispora sp. ZYX-F-249]|uniref:YdeI/OmpD-associated family protein n=1 Tax=Microbispora maris TaxID=3144104 RepID=A0ABV0AXC1_9ACTN
MRFRAKIQLDGKTATGIRVPVEVIEALGSGKRPPVKVTIGDYSYRTTIGVYGPEFLVPVSAENRKGAGVAAGDEVDVDIELDTEPRVVTVPEDLAKALADEPAAKTFFEGLTHSQKKGFVTWIEQAKKAETREQRVVKSLAALREGRNRP